MNFIHPILYLIIVFFSSSSYAQKETLIPFQKDSLWGYMNQEGTVIISSRFQDIQPFKENLAVAKMNGEYGIIDSKGTVRVPFSYTDMELRNAVAILSNVDSLGQAKYGCFIEEGDILLHAIYDEIKIHLPFVFFKKGRLWGLMGKDAQGPTAIQYDKVNGITGLPIARSKRGTANDFFTATGDRIQSNYGELIDLIKLPNVNNLVLGKVLDKTNQINYVLIEISSNYMIQEKALFDRIEYKNHGFPDHIYRVKSEDKVGLIDSSGHSILPLIYEDIIDHYDGILFKVKLDGKTILVNRNGQNVLPKEMVIYNRNYVPQYTGIQILENVSGRQFVALLDTNGSVGEVWKVKRGKVDAIFCCPTNGITIQRGSKKQFYASDGNRLIKKRYDEFIRLNETLFAGIKQNKFTLYFNGKRLLNKSFDQLNSLGEEVLSEAVVQEDLLSFQQGESWGTINLITGNIIVPFNSNIQPIVKSSAILISQKSKMGIVDKNGTIILPLEYDDINVFSEDLFGVKRDNSWHLYHKRSIIPNENFDAIRRLKNGFIQVKKHGKYGLYTLGGDQITSTSYQSIECTGINDLVIVTKDNHSGIYSIAQRKILVQLKYTKIEEGKKGVFLLHSADRLGVWTSKDGLIIPVQYVKIIFHQGLIETYDSTGFKSYNKLDY